MIKIKNYISLLAVLIVCIALFMNADVITEKLKTILYIHPEIVIKPGNDYVKKDKFNFIEQVDAYEPYNYDDLKNIFYSILNQGWEEFTFYCPNEYVDCLKDVEKISDDKALLSDINNFVHPYNSYSTIKTLYDDMGEVTIKVSHLYSDKEIKKIDSDIDTIIKKNTTSSMSDREKIKSLHDYIVNNTKYDIKRANDQESDYDSARILGVLYDHYSICSGYADLMAVILNKFEIPNYKIASESHVWNAVYLDGEWLHLDLTWDDPVTASGKDVLDHTYFLIDTNTLEGLNEKNNTEHIYDKKIYYELK